MLLTAQTLGLFQTKTMSAIEETKSGVSVKPSTTRTASAKQQHGAAEHSEPKQIPQQPASASIMERGLELLSSVRFGILLLVLLVVACMMGMLIMQQSVDGFDKYYAELTPSQKLLYGSLSLFDIYHAWYFNALLVILSLNIVLASIDRFPKAWTFVSRPKLDASATYLRAQKQHAAVMVEGSSKEAVAERVAAACRSVGLKPRITEKNGRTYIFGQRGVWNRLGAYAVHVALLTIFLGGFLTAQFGHTGNMKLMPGSVSSEMVETVFRLDQVASVNVPLPFTVTCTDIQQKLIKKDGSILQDNTIDWLTRLKIKDEYGEREALVNLNHPYDYQGYRFFQASYDETGNARNITLRLTPENGEGPPQDVSITRDRWTKLADGTRIDYLNFFPDFTINSAGRPETASKGYINPGAQLRVTTASGEQKVTYAFAADLPAGARIAAPVGGYKFRLADFEKVPTAHVLSVQRDPGSRIVYVGFALLALTLCGVFFFAHQRVWALVEAQPEDTYEVLLGGNTNRNQPAFEERFNRLTETVKQSSFQAT